MSESKCDWGWRPTTVVLGTSNSLESSALERQKGVLKMADNMQGMGAHACSPGRLRWEHLLVLG